MPPGLRKSGMPDSVLMPAPVNTTTRFASASMRASASGPDLSLIALLWQNRRGHVEGISPERFRGRAELPLTETGRGQAEAAARCIAASWQPAAIYTSPLGRCVETGAAIAKAVGLAPSVMLRLNDIDYGEWQ